MTREKYSNMDPESVFTMFEYVLDNIYDEYECDEHIIESVFSSNAEKVKLDTIKNLNSNNKKLFNDSIKNAKNVERTALQLYKNGKFNEAKKNIDKATDELNKVITKITGNCDQYIEILDEYGHEHQADKQEKIKNNYIDKLNKQKDVLDETKKYIDMKNNISKDEKKIVNNKSSITNDKKIIKESSLYDNLLYLKSLPTKNENSKINDLYKYMGIKEGLNNIYTTPIKKIRIGLKNIKKLIKIKKYDDAKILITESLVSLDKIEKKISLMKPENIPNSLNIVVIKNSYKVEDTIFEYQCLKYAMLDYIARCRNELNTYSIKITQLMTSDSVKKEYVEQDMFEEAVDLQKIDSDDLKIKKMLPNYYQSMIMLKKNLYHIDDYFKNNRYNEIVNTIDTNNHIIYSIIKELKIGIGLVNNLENDTLIVRKLLTDAHDILFYVSLFNKYIMNINTESLPELSLLVKHIYDINCKKISTACISIKNKINSTNTLISTNEFEKIQVLCISAYNTVLVTMKSVQDIILKIPKDVNIDITSLSESSSSVIGSMLPQGCGYDTINPYIDSLPLTVKESMIELEKFSNIYMEETKNILKKIINTKNKDEKIDKKKNEKIDASKVRKICSVYNKKKIAKGNIDLIKATGRSTINNSDYNINKKNLITSEKQYRKLYKSLNNSEREVVDNYCIGFDSSYDKRIRNKVDNVKKHTKDDKDIKQGLMKKINIVAEAANIDKEIADDISILNSKGYKTKYSSAGHTKLRKQSDVDHDGVYYGKLYTDARIMFDAEYKFPDPPKYWRFKIVDGKDYLDVIPITYDKKDGTPDEAFYKWKTNYMNSLRSWIEKLPEKKESDKIIMKDGTVTESSNDFYNDLFNELYLDTCE